jgi:plastocyanin/predicted secreted protein
MLGVQMNHFRRLWWTVLPAALALLASCGQTPEETEKARGVLTGAPVVLAMSILFIVLAVGAVAVAVAFDRTVRSRKALADAPAPVDEEEEEQDEIVAGITVGRAAVPRWLYAAYVLIPVFALAYVFSNVAVAPAATGPKPTATPSGPCTECAIVMAQIKFDKSELEVAAGKPITVAAANKDNGVPHTFTVWKSKADAEGKGKPVADSGTYSAGSRDVKFTSPAAGTNWYFDCTVHPTSMFGDIVTK